MVHGHVDGVARTSAGVAALIVGAGVTKPDAVEEMLLGDGAHAQGSAARERTRADDHYGAGIVDANAALKKAQDGQAARASWASAAAMALLGHRAHAAARRAPSSSWASGFAAALVAGSSGLFFLPELLPQSWTHAHAVGAALSGGFGGHAAPGRSARTRCVLSALAPLALTVLLYGVRKLRPALAGFGFGVAGALLFAAVSGTVDVQLHAELPRPASGWSAHAGLAALVATAVVRKTTDLAAGAAGPG